MSKAALNIKPNDDIVKFNKLIMFVKKQAEKYLSEKTKVVEKKQVQQFHQDAP